MMNSLFLFSGFPLCFLAVEFTITLVIVATIAFFNVLLLYGAIKYCRKLKVLSIVLSGILSTLSLFATLLFLFVILQDIGSQCTEYQYGLLAVFALTTLAVVLCRQTRRISRFIPYIVILEIALLAPGLLLLFAS